MKNDIIEEKFSHFSENDKEIIRKAYAIAQETLKDKVRDNGHPFIEHPLNVAEIVADEIGLDAGSVAAVFLHESTRNLFDTNIRSANFNNDIYTMVDGLNKISTIKPKDTRLEAENYKKLIIQYSTDPRVTIIKIADRLEIMRNLNMFPRQTRERKIMETLMLYIPLAHQLGLYNVKSEMEDIYFRFAEPEQYRLITNKLKATEQDRINLTNDFIEPLKKTLSEKNIRYKLKVRTKTAYSIFKKMQAQKVPFEGVFDVYAIRFIIDCDGDPAEEKRLCWDVYSYVTNEYEPDTSRLRDWVTNPKANGYESLHITVKNKDGASIEVQIRTKRMDEIAESGHASHWSYKGISYEATIDNWLKTVRYNLEHPQAINPEDIPQPPSKEIFVFTPSGELRILKTGSSVLDFAFNIHSNLGIRCTGAKVNGKTVTIRHKLQTGDIVEIISGKNQKPSQDWLNFVITSKARNKIKQILHEAEYKAAAEGKELLTRRLKNWKLTFPDDIANEFMKRHNFNTVNALYASIGNGDTDINFIKNYILEHDQIEQAALDKLRQADQEAIEAAKENWRTHNSRTGDDIIIINNEDLKGLDYKMSKCCNPVYGDDVFAFVTRDNGIKIHRLSCPNAARLLTKYPYRTHRVKWAETPSTGSFQVGLRLTASKEPTVINDIMDIVNTFKASIRSFQMNEDNVHGLYKINMKISVPSNMELDKVISCLRQNKFIEKVNRN